MNLPAKLSPQSNVVWLCVCFLYDDSMDEKLFIEFRKCNCTNLLDAG